jgi:hypothetical protein
MKGDDLIRGTRDRTFCNAGFTLTIGWAGRTLAKNMNFRRTPFSMMKSE